MTVSHTSVSNRTKVHVNRRYNYNKKAGDAISLYLCLNMTNVAVKLLSSNSLLGMLMSILILLLFVIHILMNNCFCVTGIKALAWAGIICTLLYGGGFLTLERIGGGYISRIYWTYVFCIPLFAIVADVNDYEAMIKQTEKAAKYCVFCAIPIFLFFLLDKSRLTSPDYSMSFGYALLFSTLYFLYQIKRSKEKKRIIYILYCLLCVTMIMSYGSRSQILCIGIYVLSEIFFMRGLQRWKKLILGIAIIGCGVLLVFEYKVLLTGLLNLLGFFGVYSRSLGYFLERTTYTGREKVWAAAVERIMEKPLLGWGFGVDTSIDGLYPHNFYLELALQYGIVIGIIMGLTVTALIIKKIYIGKEHNEVLLLFFCCGFVPLLLTSEYLVWPTFWIFLSICFFEHQNRRVNKF